MGFLDDPRRAAAGDRRRWTTRTLIALLAVAGASVAALVPGIATAADRRAPTVTVTAPAGGASVSGSTTLGASASDKGGVTVVRWYVDGTEVASDAGGAPWQASWDSSTVTDGAHQVMARATDAAGNVGTARTVSFRTANATTTPIPTPTPTPTPPPSPGGPCGTATTPPASYDHVVWIVMENHSYADIVGNASAPYINQVAKQCGSAAAMSAETHPSLPNYIAMTSGSTQGIADDNGPSSHPLAVPSIFSQAATNGWRSLQESMPSNCAPSSSGQYAVKHNPAAYYTNIAADCARFDTPLSSPPDLSARFTFVTPNMCNDMHDCSVETGDAWLSNFLPAVFSSAVYQAGRTAVFLTWDEDDSSASNHIPTLVMAPSVVPGTTTTAAFNHYSMLRTTEELLNLGFLGNAATAPSMRSAFGL